jgi:hypothetical protein
MSSNLPISPRAPVTKTVIRAASITIAGAVAIAFAFQGCSSGPRMQSQSDSSPAQSRTSGSLTVLLIVDQMRQDYIERFRPLLLKTDTGNQGLLWLADSGVRFENTRTAAAPTVTAAGHASVCTGSVPAVHGVAANEYFDRSDASSKPLVSDPEAKIVRTVGMLGSGPLEQTSPDSGASPWRLRTSTLGERFKAAAAANGQLPGKSIAVAIKDRAALICAGSNNDGAYYFDAKSGSLVTSSRTGQDALPTWVDTFNRSRRPEMYGDWNLVLKEKTEYGAALDPREFAATNAFLNTRTQKIGKAGEFPHSLRPQPNTSLLEVYDRFTLMPGASDYIVDFALEAALSEKLGQGGSSDILVISFSSPDLVGHSYGSASLELVDTYLHLHASIERLRSKLPSILGHERITYALTADHAVQQIPEAIQAKAANGTLGGRIDAKAFQLEANRLIAAHPGLGAGEWISAFVSDQLFLNHTLIRAKGLNVTEVSNDLSKKIENLPGIFAVFSAAEVAKASEAYGVNRFSSDALRNLVGMDKRSYALRFLSRGYHPSVAGDIYVVPREGWQFSYPGIAANHGTPWDADSRIPWLLAGSGVPRGVTILDATFADDVVPTLLDIARFEAREAAPPDGMDRTFEGVTGKSRKSLFERQ